MRGRRRNEGRVAACAVGWRREASRHVLWGRRWYEGRGEVRRIKIGGEHITAGSYYNPAVMLTYHRRFVIRPGGDAYVSITAESIWNRL